MATMRELCASNKICAILRNVPDQAALDFAKACVEGGVRMFEIAMNTPHAADQIRQISRYFGKDVLVGRAPWSPPSAVRRPTRPGPSSSSPPPPPCAPWPTAGATAFPSFPAS